MWMRRSSSSWLKRAAPGDLCSSMREASRNSFQPLHASAWSALLLEASRTSSKPRRNANFKVARSRPGTFWRVNTRARMTNARSILSKESKASRTAVSDACNSLSARVMRRGRAGNAGAASSSSEAVAVCKCCECWRAGLPVRPRERECPCTANESPMPSDSRPSPRPGARSLRGRDVAADSRAIRLMKPCSSSPGRTPLPNGGSPGGAVMIPALLS